MVFFCFVFSPIVCNLVILKSDEHISLLHLLYKTNFFFFNFENNNKIAVRIFEMNKREILSRQFVDCCYFICQGHSNKIEATLLVRRAMPYHSGNYTCNSLHSNYHRLHVKKRQTTNRKSTLHSSLSDNYSNKPKIILYPSTIINVIHQDRSSGKKQVDKENDWRRQQPQTAVGRDNYNDYTFEEMMNYNNISHKDSAFTSHPITTDWLAPAFTSDEYQQPPPPHQRQRQHSKHSHYHNSHHRQQHRPHPLDAEDYRQGEENNFIPPSSTTFVVNELLENVGQKENSKTENTNANNVHLDEHDDVDDDKLNNYATATPTTAKNYEPSTNSGVIVIDNAKEETKTTETAEISIEPNINKGKITNIAIDNGDIVLIDGADVKRESKENEPIKNRVAAEGEALAEENPFEDLYTNQHKTVFVMNREELLKSMFDSTPTGNGTMRKEKLLSMDNDDKTTFVNVDRKSDNNELLTTVTTAATTTARVAATVIFNDDKHDTRNINQLEKDAIDENLNVSSYLCDNCELNSNIKISLEDVLAKTMVLPTPPLLPSDEIFLTTVLAPSNINDIQNVTTATTSLPSLSHVNINSSPLPSSETTNNNHDIGKGEN